MTTPFLKPATQTVGKTTKVCGTETRAITELLIVEGKSAANALDQVRDRHRQGIFMMQGKIPNPQTARPARLQQHAQCAALMQLLGSAPNTDPKTTPSAAATEASGEECTTTYDHVVIVPDADVDGRHSAILLIELFRKYLSGWVTAGHLHLFRTPLARVDDYAQTPVSETASAAQPHYLDTQDEVRQWITKRNQGITTDIDQHSGPCLTHYKGLAAINRSELATLLCYPVHSNIRSLCLTPAPPPKS